MHLLAVAHKQQGLALISTLLVFAIAAILASQMILHIQADIKRTSWVTTSVQARQYAMAGESLARIALKNALNDDLKNRDNKTYRSILAELLKSTAKFRTDYGSIVFQIIDLQARINLNNIKDKEGFPSVVKNYLDQQQAEPLFTDSLLDWIDDDSNPTGFGAESDFYVNRTPPHHSANQPLIFADEILAIQGMSPDWYATNQAQLTALPETTRININNADASVINALAPGLDGEQVVAARDSLEGGYQSIESFTQATALAGMDFDSNVIDVSSNWFSIKTHAIFDGHQIILISRHRFDEASQQLILYDRTTRFTLHNNLVNEDISALRDTDNEQPAPIF